MKELEGFVILIMVETLQDALPDTTTWRIIPGRVSGW